MARRRHPEFDYEIAFPDTDSFAASFKLGEKKFDYILFNYIGVTVDVQRALQNLKPLCERHTRLLITEAFISFLQDRGFAIFLPGENGLVNCDRPPSDPSDPDHYLNLFAKKATEQS